MVGKHHHHQHHHHPINGRQAVLFSKSLQVLAGTARMNTASMIYSRCCQYAKPTPPGKGFWQ
jgi:hypothetical protein